MNPARISLLVLFLLSGASGVIAQHATVTPETGNFLYMGIPNRVTVKLHEADADCVIVTASNSKVDRYNNWHWLITPDTGFNTTIITIVSFKKQKVTSRDTTEYELLWLPDPKIYVHHVSGTHDSITKSDLLATYIVSCRAENFYYDVHYYVLSYDFRVEPYAPAYHSDAAYLTPEIRVAIMNAKTGDRAVFYNILVKYPDGRRVPAKDVIITFR